MGAEASTEWVTRAPLAAVLIPSRIVLPLIVGKEGPCQLTVQPPTWLAMSWALEPATYTRCPARSGSAPPLFFSSTCARPG
ncbi:hypothetical protein GCM10014713_48990 [Streptomyces purpureus]|uniref:Uncharacterized protein n=1 Tax=Streptomyces purpureus TaxID=1951 RepID=A0A918HB45_9ACTN|nr:hypothetical protein GCM10014713_48990 [Streptomyces purpureus]